MEGGTASSGFLGVFELAVLTSAPQSVTLLNPGIVAGQFRFEFDSQAGVTHVVQFKASLTDTNWQTLDSIVGDGTRKQVFDSLAASSRFYRVSNP